MPTPDEDTVPLPATRELAVPRSLPHATCPPESESHAVHTTELGQHQITLAGPAPSMARDVNDAGHSEPTASTSGTPALAMPSAPHGDNSSDDSAPNSERSTPSPNNHMNHPKFDPSQFPAASSPSALSPFPPPLRSPEIPSTRQATPQHTSSFLRNGSKFVGTQQSDRQVYNVSVEVKHVDMRESFICGYLRIEGLTPDHPTLTTYFEGEIIGTKYTFQTRHSEWGVNEKVDMQHWNRFPAWRPLARQAKSPGFSYKNYADREHLFMRWKEYFLVPDHRVTSISGASFEGFYYICFNQVSGSVSGIYFHSKSEKFQQLELKHVHDYGCKAAMDFA